MFIPRKLLHAACAAIIGLAAAGAYLTLYRRVPRSVERQDTGVMVAGAGAQGTSRGPLGQAQTVSPSGSTGSGSGGV